MKIEVIAGGPFGTNSYLLIGDKNHALIIDPTFDSLSFFIEMVSKYNCKPIAIILTHSHFDHIVEVSNIKEEFKIPVYIHDLDKDNLINPGADGLPFDLEIQGVQPDVILKDGDIFHLEELYFQVIHTPGHSYGSCCFYFPDDVLLISGDTLFKGTYGNTSFPTSDSNEMKKSLHKLSKLPKETTVWPGHGEPTTIGSENWLQKLDQIIED